jgi:hypothetical protein
MLCNGRLQVLDGFRIVAESSRDHTTQVQCVKVVRLPLQIVANDRLGRRELSRHDQGLDE